MIVLDEILFTRVMRSLPIRKVLNKRITRITICETCDKTFDYVPQKRFCDECYRVRIRHQRKMKRKENRKQINATARERYHEQKKVAQE